jgi:dipeptidyl aminopeptidase/acylaminoacyl peptidase
MTSEDLVTMHRLSAPAVSPDGRYLAFQMASFDFPENQPHSHLWLLDLKRGGEPALLAISADDLSERDPQFSADGKWIYYLAGAPGKDQLWRVAVGGGAPEQLTDFPIGIGGYLLAPGGERLVIWGDRPVTCQDYDCKDPKPEAEVTGSGRTYGQLFVRHWDQWKKPGTRSRLFAMRLEQGRIAGRARIVAGDHVGDVPSKPFGGAEELGWGPDGRTLYFALRKGDRVEEISTNLDILAASLDGQVENLTTGNLATDNYPAPSPDGKWLAYAAMRRPGYESDRFALVLRNIRTGATRPIAPNWDRSVSSITWSPNGRSLLVTAPEVLDVPLFRVDVATGKVTRLTQGGSVGNVRPLPDGSIVFTRSDLQLPDDLYRLRSNGALEQLTHANADKLRQIDPVTVRRFSFAGANGDTVWGQITRPTGAGKWPVLLLIHGGPQGTFPNGWSWRWNPKLFASPGYAVVSIDFHGSLGYGQAFTDSVNKDWGGKPLEDLKLGLAAAVELDSSLDGDNACALGGSFGGYMVNWIQGNWRDRFKCLVDHAGTFDSRSKYYETDELWFTEWENGGPYFQQSAEFERWNPVNLVGRWKTPMLITHGEGDFRVPYTQSLGAFAALQRRNIPSRLLIFPDETHFVVKPRNVIQWYHEVFAWVRRWTAAGSSEPHETNNRAAPDP